ncbi:PHD finger protein 12 [Alosa sapidissima]|uniref:PHD finger protein 12 n=1 Tax=Alosa sapidissima TaxID=34773 RepID=UPI001C07F698|nr:PHD finger protein 12 [Alosa sapidissima]XP_041918794.1 PHD finger protein 12 [Alosa sapidissima]
MWDKMETPRIVYDLDTSGGLMEQIQTLLAPPKSEDGEKKRKPEREPRRSGRANNHDTCDSCREGGDLLCCDHCPAAFHLQCCNPPLSEEMLPPGDWMCHRCNVHKKKREQKAEQMNGLLECPLSKRSSSPAAELDLSAGAGTGPALRLDGLPPVPGGGGGSLRVAVAQVRLLERRVSSRPSSRPGTPTSNASTDTPTPSEPNDADEEMLDPEEDAPGSETDGATGGPRLKRPFELLIAAAMEQNPTQFQLPNELTCTTALPGSSKRRRKEEMTGKNVKRQQHELDPSGLVPLPVRLCYSCSRSCRVAPLVQCDYCPLLFHMDCLDPPLTAMPTGRWMCPNHIEHVVLNQRSTTYSNRCQLFDRFQDRISQNAVKVDFLRLAHRQNLPHRKGPHHSKLALKVPDSIKSQYQCPPPLPEPSGVRQGELICHGVPEKEHQAPLQYSANEAEQQEWLRGVIALQCSVMRHLSAKQMPSSKRDSKQSHQADVKPCVEANELSSPSPTHRTHSPSPLSKPCSARVGPQGAPVVHKPQAPSEQLDRCSDSSEKPCQDCRPLNGLLEGRLKANGPVVHEVTEQGDHKPTRLPSPSVLEPSLPNHVKTDGVKTEKSGPPLSVCAQRESPRLVSPASSGASSVLAGEVASMGGAKVSSSVVDTHTFTLPRPIQDKPTDRLASPLPPSGGKVSPGSMSMSPAIAALSGCLKGVVEGKPDIELSKLDEDMVRMLAWQRIQQLFPKKVSQLPKPCGVPSPISASPSPPTPTPPSEAQKKEVQARAAFYPVLGKGEAVSMRYRTLYIGTGAEMDVCLTKYGHCNYVSGKHACIFYDENTKHYELLNYSEHGTTVDNVLYSCDFSEKVAPTPPSSLVSKVQSITRRCKKRKSEAEDAVEGFLPAGGVMSSQCQAESSRHQCNCKASSSSLIGGSGAGWEGTALLHHGSCVKLGCLQFIFSIAEFAAKQPKEEVVVVEEVVMEVQEDMACPVQESQELAGARALSSQQVPVLHSNSVP